MKAHARAPGKIILFGEHFVVYNATAIVMAIDKYVYTSVSRRRDSRIRFRSINLGLEGIYEGEAYKPISGGLKAKSVFDPLFRTVRTLLGMYGGDLGLDIEINSEIPVAAGLGSSAATSVSLTAATAYLLGIDIDRRTINSISYESESIIHVTPSGVDNTIATYGGLIRYNRGWKRRILKLSIDYQIPILVGDTGISRNTGIQVSKVRLLANNYPDVFKYILRVYNELYKEAIATLRDKDLIRLGELMNINQGLLSSIGVSSQELERLISIAIEKGAYGAKLTGAGGGGCMIALVDRDRMDGVKWALDKASSLVLEASTDRYGVRVWSD